MSDEINTGGCRCGDVRFAASGAPVIVANCHCKDCRKATGAAFATFVDYDRGHVTFESNPASFQSSPGVERLFCSRCGSPIAYRGKGSPDEINILIGAFDHPERFRPTEDAHKESALWKPKT